MVMVQAGATGDMNKCGGLRRGEQRGEGGLQEHLRLGSDNHLALRGKEFKASLPKNLGR